MSKRKIETFNASFSLTTALGRIDLALDDQSRKTFDRLDSQSFTATMSILQGSPEVYFIVDPASKQEVIATSAESTG